jgi:hypothetical protein
MEEGEKRVEAKNATHGTTVAANMRTMGEFILATQRIVFARSWFVDTQIRKLLDACVVLQGSSPLPHFNLFSVTKEKMLATLRDSLCRISFKHGRTREDSMTLTPSFSSFASRPAK